MKVSNSQEKLLFICFSPCRANTDTDKLPCAESIFFSSLVFNLGHIPSEAPHLCFFYLHFLSYGGQCLVCHPTCGSRWLERSKYPEGSCQLHYLLSIYCQDCFLFFSFSFFFFPLPFSLPSFPPPSLSSFLSSSSEMFTLAWHTVEKYLECFFMQHFKVFCNRRVFSCAVRLVAGGRHFYSPSFILLPLWHV